jgi:hypothetical protein
MHYHNANVFFILYHKLAAIQELSAKCSVPGICTWSSINPLRNIDF